MAREEDETREVQTGEQPKLNEDEKNLLLGYYNERRRERDSTKSFLERKMREGVFWSHEGSLTLARESARYAELVGETARLSHLLMRMGRKGEI